MKKTCLIFRKKDCMGCHACEVACKQEHALGVGPRLVRIVEKSPEFIPVYCHHCAKPPCRAACPAQAISRTEQGIVLIDEGLCIGCRECVEACPFGAMQFEDHREVAVKCDLCRHRLAESKLPACMSVCPTGCIGLGATKNIAAVFEKPTSRETAFHGSGSAS
ncbi:MAG TPA: 4Fe-4S dicluster domain-containing protein [Desulfosarcina sp.]|nr:4Fe-4S dicluster domain-containing protein [Desulfosarcina sp.]